MYNFELMNLLKNSICESETCFNCPLDSICTETLGINNIKDRREAMYNGMDKKKVREYLIRKGDYRRFAKLLGSIDFK